MAVLAATLVGCGAAGTPSPKAPPWADVTIVPFETGTPTPAPPETAGAPSLPAGPLTVVTLGDSLTEGQGDDSGLGGYPGRLERLLEQARPGSHVVNLGHSGWSSTALIQGTNEQPSELAAAVAVHPDVALVWIGSNDLWYLYEFGPEPMTSEAEAQDLATYEANLDRILHDLAAAGALVIVARLDDQSKRPVAAHPNSTEPAFPNTTAADLALMSKHIQAYNGAIARKATQYGALKVDFWGSGIFTDAATLYGDGNHPNSAGYEQVTNVWWSALQPLSG
jgi:lysophospholipase L1-like esterase